MQDGGIAPGPWPAAAEVALIAPMRRVRLEDLMGPARYDREGSDLLSRGLYLDLPPYRRHVFRISAEA
jgi:hypothetical protein